MDKYSRQKEIVNYLIKDNSFVTSKILANYFNVSSRTIKNDLKEIASNKESMGCEVYVSKEGYRLECKNYKLLAEYHSVLERSSDYNIQSNRIRYIILKALTSNDKKISKIQSELNISETTLNKDINIVKSILKENNINLMVDKNIFVIEADETDIRRCISRYIDIDYSTIYKYNLLFSESAISKTDIEFLTNKFIEILHDNEIEIVGIQITNIIIHVIVSIHRIRHGFNIIKTFEYQTNNELEQKVTDLLANTISDHFEIILSDTEREYLKYCFVGRGLNINNHDLRVKIAILNTFDTIKNFYGIDLGSYEDSKPLYMHTVAMYNRIKSGITIDKSIVGYIRENFVLAYEMAIIYQKELVSIQNIEIPDAEVCYLTVHFGALIEQYKMKDKIAKILIVTEGNAGHILLLKNSLLSYFGNKIKIIAIVSPYELQKIDEYEYEYILTTENLDLNDSNKAIYQIPILLNNKNLKLIDSYIKKSISIKEIFNKNLFKIINTPISAKDCLSDLLEKCQRLEFINDSNDVLLQTMEREEIQSTKFNEILALPHPIKPIANKNFIYCVISEKGIKWFDNSTAKLIMFVGINKETKEEIRSIFDVLSTICSSSVLINELIKSKDYDDFIQKLEKGL